MNPPVIPTIEDLKFRYDIFNGNARCIEWDQGQPILRIDDTLSTAINQALKSLFGEDYVVPEPISPNSITAKQQRGYWVMQLIADHAILKCNRMEEPLAFSFSTVGML